jgi:hypothetical protein
MRKSESVKNATVRLIDNAKKCDNATIRKCKNVLNPKSNKKLFKSMFNDLLSKIYIVAKYEDPAKIFHF